MQKAKKNKPYVLVRTCSAGVHIGSLCSQKGQEVILENARRIWRWFGANTLHEIALRGVGEKSRISEAVPKIILTEAIEIIPVRDEAQKNLDRSIWP